VIAKVESVWVQWRGLGIDPCHETVDELPNANHNVELQNEQQVLVDDQNVLEVYLVKAVLFLLLLYVILCLHLELDYKDSEHDHD
jgi:hypothetical protein